MITLENEQLQVTFKTLGAELTKIYSKETSIDYLWNGDEIFWKRHAPILFPIVGKLKDNTYVLNQKEYHLSQHGFARDHDFSIIAKTDTYITFELLYSEESLKIYPYKFSLQITYKLKGNNLQIQYCVINKDTQNIHFSIGAHPAFKCPLSSKTSFSDYFIEFESDENPIRHYLNQQNGLRTAAPLQEKVKKTIPLNYHLFEKDALIFENIKSKKISLKSDKHLHGIDFEFKNWQFFAFWTKNEAPFICFEPWMGASDIETTNQEFITKDSILQLAKNEEYHNSYNISFF